MLSQGQGYQKIHSAQHSGTSCYCRCSKSFCLYYTLPKLFHVQFTLNKVVWVRSRMDRKNCEPPKRFPRPRDDGPKPVQVPCPGVAAKFSRVTDEKQEKTLPTAKVSMLADEENREMTTLASDIVSDEEIEEKFQKIKVSLLETTPAAIGSLYFSALTEDQLVALFCKGPLLRIQICAVEVNCKRSGIRNKLHGFIQIVGDDHASKYVFSREVDEPLVIQYNSMFLPDICCSVPASNNAVEIHAKLYLTTDKDFKRFSSDDKNLELSNDDAEKLLKEYDEWFNANCEKDDAFFVTDADANAFFVKDADTDTFYEKEIDIKDNEPFEFYDDYLAINLLDHHFGPHILRGKGGCAELYCVALKYAVDATLELDFVADNKAIKVDASIRASYGTNFDYGCDARDKSAYPVMLFLTYPEIDSGDFLVPGKLNLSVSKLAVPVQFPLIIDAAFQDITSRNLMSEGSYEFHVPRNGSSSFGTITGNGCSLDMKMDWNSMCHAMVAPTGGIIL